MPGQALAQFPDGAMLSRCVPIVTLDLIDQTEKFVQVGTFGRRVAELDAQCDGHVGVLLGSNRDDRCVDFGACVARMLNEAFQVA